MHVTQTKHPGNHDTRAVKVDGRTIGLIVLQKDGTVRVPRLDQAIFDSRVQAVDALMRKAGLR